MLIRCINHVSGWALQVQQNLCMHVFVWFGLQLMLEMRQLLNAYTPPCSNIYHQYYTNSGSSCKISHVTVVDPPILYSTKDILNKYHKHLTDLS